ncbi:DUF1501 domain-containing protein [Lentisphaera profundi]|uniref:DUF1501 domain-containing protein n=1 Tax=Lentisphaera profundi TaxID=1658616 RepID=A0ABY7W480_9BACT|nr:DUF1501 domain-containing protein [Lentisphaera profundi]WDE99043.1 DUF1501 domain-containing protein [Lentisphaera profundi]
MNLANQFNNLQNRRQFLSNSTLGLGALSLMGLNTDASETTVKTSDDIGLPDLPHFAPKAKRVIWLCMAGAPSQLDMFDYKPTLEKMFDKDLPESIRNGQRLTGMTANQSRFPLAPSKFKFKQHGQSGAWVSELMPHTAKMVDDLCIMQGMHTEQINHDPAITYLQTGNQIPGRPCMGSWLSYGLGSMNKNLPTYVAMTPSWTGRKDAQALYQRLWGSGFLPSEHQGIGFRSQGDPVLYLSDPKGVNSSTRRNMLDSLAAMNRKHFKDVNDPEINTRISQYEMAFRMQTSVPELTDTSKEKKSTLEMYGPDVHKKGTFAASCLLARRMVERDVRMVQIFHRGWDQHHNIAGDLPNQCKDIDQACYGLIQDLKQNGLLEDTLVVWGGEFGRTNYCQGKLTRENYGRDHHPRAFTMWMAGGGVKPGIVHGETDEFGYNVVKDGIHINDLNATILNQLGIDHNRLTYKFQGLDFKLTGVEGANIVKDILI